MRISCVLVVALLLSACTSYQPEGFTGGFSEVPLSASSYEITTRGNGYTSPARAQAITLVRAAELTLDKGFDTFVIVGKADAIKQSTAIIGGGTYQSSSTMNAHVSGNNIYGTGTTSGYYTPPTVVDIEKPRSTVVIQMFHRSDPYSQSGLIPQEIINTYGPTVGYKGKYALQVAAPPSAPAQ